MAMVRRAVVQMQRRFYCFLHHNPVLCDNTFATSYVVPQPALGAVRAAVFAYCFAVLATNLIINIVHGAGWSWAAYFTTLTFFGITLYYGLAAWVTVRYTWICRRAAYRRAMEAAASPPVALAVEQQLQPTGKVTQHAAADTPPESNPATLVTTMVEPEQHQPQPEPERQPLVSIAVQDEITEHPQPAGASRHQPPDEIAEQPTPDEISEQQVPVEEPPQPTARASTAHQLALATQWLLYESFICFAPLVTLIYWVLLYPTQSDLMDGAVDWWMGVSMHAFNMVLMLLEVLVFARCPCQWRHFAAIAGFMVLYLGLVYFMVGVYGFYVYPFFEPHYFGGYIAVMCLLIVNIAAVIWTIHLMIHRLRDALYPRWLARHCSDAVAAPLPLPRISSSPCVK
ncbi:hypothetical protein H4R21_000508 [Coemansia helicoidea]|uniref:Uncharacterized protein n=1 Tax=Coemansia helicoidea TaxID=1286919 RepID=A0ACC1LG18_9FUNG|nr:hypothetical protein H4R21_000508 [Coemansia helicoidea]